MCTHLVPLLDLVNHDEEANAERTGDGQVVTLSASRHIKKGQVWRGGWTMAAPWAARQPRRSLAVPWGARTS